MRIDPAHHRADAAGLLATLSAGDLIDHDPPSDRRRVIGLVIPEVESVEAVVREPQAALMRVVRRLAVDLFHWKVTRDNFPGSRSQWMQIRPYRLAAPDYEMR